MSIFQVLAVFFALFMLYVLGIHKKKSKLTPLEVSFWYSTWFAFIVIAIFPNLLLGISNALNFTRVFDLLVVGAMMVLTVVVIMGYFQQKENNLKLEKFVREEAIKKAKIYKPKSNN